MGVTGLQTFLQQHSPTACYWADIAKLVKNYKTKTGKDAKIVVDAQSCYQLWYANTDWLLAYEVQQYILRLLSFVGCFSKLNVALTFIFGGVHSENERKAWLTEHEKSIADVHQAIDSWVTSGRLPEDFQALLPCPGLTTMYILKYFLHCDVRVAINNCREEIVKYAHEHECFAIFGENTDYVVSEMNTRFILLPTKFTIKEMTTLVYDRVRFAFKLGFDTSDLPLLAIMAGNDLIPVAEIKQFHYRICPSSKRELPIGLLIRAIAHHLHLIPRQTPIEEKLERLAELLFEDGSHVELLRASYNSYFVAKSSDTSSTNGNSNSAPPDSATADNWSKILHTARDRCRNALLPCLAYSVLSEQIFEAGTTFEDLRVYRSMNALTRYQPSSTVLRPLRSRLYGILLYEKDAAEDASMPDTFVVVQDVTVQEWCNESANSYAKAVVVKPVEPEVYHPGLMKLWNGDDSVNEDRWKLFLATISPSLKAAQWRSFNEDLLCAVLSAYHLYDIEYLNEAELDAVLVTIATSESLYAAQLSSLRYKRLDFRAANITITLNRAFQLVLTILGTCGYPFKLSQHNSYLKFEGKVFQIKYAAVVKEKTTDIKSLCGNNDTYYMLYKQMKDLIIGTEDVMLDDYVACKLCEMQV